MYYLIFTNVYRTQYLIPFNALGTEGMKQIWHEAKLCGRGYANASSILEYALKLLW